MKTLKQRIEGGRGQLRGEPWLGRAGGSHRGLIHSADEQPRQRFRRLPDVGPDSHRLLQTGDERSEFVDGVDLSPAVPPEHGRGVKQDYSLNEGIETGGEKSVTAGPQRRRGIGGSAGGSRDASSDLGLNRGVERGEEPLLAVEMMIERASAEPGSRDELIASDGVTASLGEERPGGPEETRSCCGAALILARNREAPRRTVFGIMADLNLNSFSMYFSSAATWRCPLRRIR